MEEDFVTLARGQMLSDKITTAIMNTQALPAGVFIGRPSFHGDLYGSGHDLENSQQLPMDQIPEDYTQ